MGEITNYPAAAPTSQMCLGLDTVELLPCLKGKLALSLPKLVVRSASSIHVVFLRNRLYLGCTDVTSLSMRFGK